MLRQGLRNFATAVWLGWQVESNWTDPFLFLIYSVLKPIASVMILVVMYLVISRDATQTPLFAYIYLGNAFYIYVTGIMIGVSWAVIDDREHYGTLKYLSLTPMHLMVYLFGRGVARLVTSTVAVFVTIAFGVLILQLPLRLNAIDWPLFLTSLALGVFSLALFGLVLGGMTLLMARSSWNAGEATAGSLYLFSGAIFPLSALPEWLRWVGYGLPITYWLELVRRSLLGTSVATYPTFVTVDNLQLLATLAGMTGVYGIAAVLFFLWAEDRARRLGLLDQQTLS